MYDSSWQSHNAYTFKLDNIIFVRKYFPVFLLLTGNITQIMKKIIGNEVYRSLIIYDQYQLLYKLLDDYLLTLFFGSKPNHIVEWDWMLAFSNVIYFLCKWCFL